MFQRGSAGFRAVQLGSGARALPGNGMRYQFKNDEELNSHNPESPATVASARFKYAAGAIPKLCWRRKTRKTLARLTRNAGRRRLLLFESRRHDASGSLAHDDARSRARVGHCAIDEIREAVDHWCRRASSRWRRGRRYDSPVVLAVLDTRGSGRREVTGRAQGHAACCLLLYNYSI